VRRTRRRRAERQREDAEREPGATERLEAADEPEHEGERPAGQPAEHERHVGVRPVRNVSGVDRHERPEAPGPNDAEEHRGERHAPA
jgi:hypothetical protein